MIYIGIDNGVTGTIGALFDKSLGGDAKFCVMPVKTEQSYTKKKQSITRIDHIKLYNNLYYYKEFNPMILIERPMVNPGRFKATVSALRALEVTIVVIENLGLRYQYIDSKEWQKVMLPKGIKGTPELKKASLDIGCRLFPQHTELIKKHKDADGLLIAEYSRRASK